MDVVESRNKPGGSKRSDAIAQLFMAHQRRLVGLAFLLVDDRETAEDVVQEAFAGLYLRWRQLRDPNAAVAYLNRAVMNGSRNQLRHRRRVGLHRDRMTLQPEELASAEHTAVQHDEAERLRTAISSLPVRRPQVLVLPLLPEPDRGRHRKHSEGVARVGEDTREPWPGHARSAHGGRLMTTPDLERRLADLLQDRAEGAMKVTNTRDKLTTLLTDGERRLQNRRRGAVAGLVAAAVAVAVAVAVGTGRGDLEGTEPASVADGDQVAVAESFLKATYAFALDAAEALLSSDVTIGGDAAVVGTVAVEEWRAGLAWAEVTGHSLADYSCATTSTSAAGTEVGCAYALNSFGSEELGREPFEDNRLDVTIVAGEITKIEEHWSYMLQHRDVAALQDLDHRGAPAGRAGHVHRRELQPAPDRRQVLAAVGAAARRVGRQPGVTG